MTSSRQILISISSELFAEANNAAQAQKVSLDQLVERALYTLLEHEEDAQMRELVENRDNDPEVEVSLEELVLGISDANIHGKND